MLELAKEAVSNVSGGDCYYAGKLYSNGAKLDNGQVCSGDSWQ